MSRQLLSIVVPLLNEADNLAALHQRLDDATKTLDRDVEMIFVDDGSTDGSFEQLQQLCARDPRVSAIRFSRNFGSHSACLAGFQHARGHHAVILAADLQDPPELLRDLVAAADRNHDVVWANRESREDASSTVLFSNLYNRMMRRIALPNFPEKGFDFVLVSRRVIQFLTSRPERNTSLFGQILWAGFPQTSISYKRGARRSGRSKWTFGKKLKLAIDSFVAFSFVPIRLISVLGLVFAALGGLYATFIVARRLLVGSPVEGWTSLIVVVLVIGGVQLVMLGVIGEYQWRTLDEARGRPPFIIADSIRSKEDAWQSSQESGSSSPAAPGSSAATSSTRSSP